MKNKATATLESSPARLIAVLVLALIGLATVFAVAGMLIGLLIRAII